MSPEKNLPLYKNLLKYLGERLGMEPVILQRSSYAEVNDLLQYDNCDVGFICTYPFVLGERSYGLKLLAVPRINGKITSQSFIVVPAESSAASLMDLRGKRFASCDIISQTGWIYPALWLQQHGENPKEFFRGVVLTATWLILVSHDLAFSPALFEVVSAFSTTGLSLGVTGNLNTFGRLLIIAVKFWGRLGAITIMLALLKRDSRDSLVRYPEETVLVG